MMEETKMKREKGFTLVELLVAMVIGLVVMSAIYSTYISQQRSSETMEEVSTRRLRKSKVTVALAVRCCKCRQPRSTQRERRVVHGACHPPG